MILCIQIEYSYYICIIIGQNVGLRFIKFIVKYQVLFIFVTVKSIYESNNHRRAGRENFDSVPTAQRPLGAALKKVPCKPLKFEHNFYNFSFWNWDAHGLPMWISNLICMGRTCVRFLKIGKIYRPPPPILDIIIGSNLLPIIMTKSNSGGRKH